MISYVEVIKGGDSVKYGSNAMGAVLVINPFFRKDEGLDLTLDTAYGSFNTIRNRIVFTGLMDPLNISGSYLSLVSDGHRDFAGGKTDVLNLGLEYRFSQNLKTRLLNKAIFLYGYDPGPASHPYSNHYYDVFRNNLHFRLEYRKDILTLNTIPFFNAGKHRLYDGFESVDYEGGLVFEAGLKPYNNLKTSFGFSMISNGGYYENVSQNTKTGFKDLSGYAVYNQTEFHLPSKISLQSGLRWHYSPVYGDFLLYQGGLFFKFYKDFYLRSRIAKNFRQPTVRELYFPFPVANPELKPEESLNRDIELGYDDQILLMSITYYKTYAKNLIKYFGAWPTVEAVNIDEYDVPGVEVNFALKNSTGMSIYVSFDKQDVGRYTKQNPDTKLNMGFEYKNLIFSNMYTFGMDMEYVSGLFEKNYSRNPMKDVFFINLSGSYDTSLFSNPLSLYIILRNLLDMQYEYIVDYPMPGINVMCGLRLKI